MATNIPDEFPCLDNDCQQLIFFKQVFADIKKLDDESLPAVDNDNYPSSIQFATDGSDGQYTAVFDTLANYNFRILPQPPASGTYIWGSVDGVQQWLETEACP